MLRYVTEIQEFEFELSIYLKYKKIKVTDDKGTY